MEDNTKIEILQYISSIVPNSKYKTNADYRYGHRYWVVVPEIILFEFADTDPFGCGFWHAIAVEHRLNKEDLVVYSTKCPPRPTVAWSPVAFLQLEDPQFFSRVLDFAEKLAK